MVCMLQFCLVPNVKSRNVYVLYLCLVEGTYVLMRIVYWYACVVDKCNTWFQSGISFTELSSVTNNLHSVIGKVKELKITFSTRWPHLSPTRIAL